ncbi:patatin-like phospholipase family protein [Nocardia gamkensis]|uniref:patatin-like phospholipase family protein n=1 Tax=Nocardia gamkensis TaxID=352869 RepID=UPI0036EAF4BA
MLIRRGLALGCGGVVGHAWSAVALAAVEQALDWDARDAEVIVGTSGGAEIAAALGAGLSTQEVVAASTGEGRVHPLLAEHVSRSPGRFPPRPAAALPALGLLRASTARGSVHPAVAAVLPRGRGDAAWLRDYGRALAAGNGWVKHPRTWLVAADAATGGRVAFGAPSAPKADLGDALAASWAIPGWFPPVGIADRWYVDGGAVSSVSADLLAPLGLDEVIVISPMTSEQPVPGRGAARFERMLRHQMTRGLNEELEALRASGARVIRVEPGAEDLVTMGANFMDASRRPATVTTATRTAPSRVAAAIRAAAAVEAMGGVAR